MPEALLVAQITDCHVVEHGQLLGGRVDTAATLQATVAHLSAMRPRPDLVVATGDLVNDGRPGKYLRLAAILAELDLPLVVVPGNHDDRTLMRRHFASVPAGGPHDRIDHVVDDHPLRLIVLDTTIPGEGGGRVWPEQMAWLDRQLASQPDRPTLVAQHHPPFTTGIAWMDATGLVDRHLEAEVVARHPQVTGVVCGHLHRVISAPFAGTVASCSASTGAQIAPALDGTPFGYTDEPPAVALHRWTATDGLVTHVSPVGTPPPWIPDWARGLLAAD